MELKNKYKLVLTTQKLYIESMCHKIPVVLHICIPQKLQFQGHFTYHIHIVPFQGTPKRNRKTNNKKT